MPIPCNLTFGIVICFNLSNKTMGVSLSLFGWESAYFRQKEFSVLEESSCCEELNLEKIARTSYILVKTGKQQ